MTLEKRIEADFLKAFKERNTEVKSLLSTVKGEMQTAKKNLVVENLSDEESIKILSKFAKNLKETLRTLAPIDGMGESIRKTSNELVIIECGDFDKYGRILVTIILRSTGENINQWMLDNNYGVVYNGGTKN
jgi:hypothetical protein